MYKTHHSQTTFGSWDVEKVHAVVSRSICRSPNVQNTPGSDHFWKLRCRKSARHCGAKQISKSKCTKHTVLRPLLEVEMSKKCTPLWREANFKVKKYKTHHSQTTFGSWDVEKVHAVVARSKFPSQKCKKLRGFGPLFDRCRKCGHWLIHSITLQYIRLQDTTTTTSLQLQVQLHFTTPHYTTLHYITLHYTTLHYITLHYITVHHTPLHYTTLHYTALHYTTLHSTTLHYTTPQYTTLHYTAFAALHYITLHFRHFTPLHYITLHYSILHCPTLHSTTLHCIALHCTTLRYSRLHYTSLNCTTLHCTYNYNHNDNYATVHYTTLDYTT